MIAASALAQLTPSYRSFNPAIAKRRLIAISLLNKTAIAAKILPENNFG